MDVVEEPDIEAAVGISALDKGRSYMLGSYNGGGDGFGTTAVACK